MIKKKIIVFFFISMFLFYTLHGKNQSLKDLYKRGYINLEKVIEINNDSFDSVLYLKDFINYSIDKTGNVFITDKSSNKIVFLNSKGEFIKTIGQTGQGPGDLNYPLNICSYLDQVIVYEMRNHRFSRFKLDGTFLRNVKSESFRILDIFPFKDNGYIFWVQKFSIDGKKPQENINIIHYDKNLKIKNILFKKQIFLNKYVGYENFPQPFSPSLLCAVNIKNEIILGFQSEKYIKIIKEDGGLKKINHKMHKKQVIDEDKESFFASMNFFDGRVIIKGASKEFRKATTFPSYKPFYKVLKTDSEDNILLFEYSEHEKKQAFYVFTSKGEYIKRVVIKNKRLNLQGIRFIKGGFLFCDGLDEDEEPFLAKYKIR